VKKGVQKFISFLCVAREELQRGTHPFRFVIEPSVRTIFCALIFLSQLHELWSYILRELCDATLMHLAFGGTLDWRCHLKHVSLKQAGSTTVKRVRLTGKRSRSTACCHNKHKKFTYRPTRDVSLLSGNASYLV
jgi:hypothetical protein